MKVTHVFPSLFLVVNSVTWFSLTWFVIRDLIQNAAFTEILLVSLAFYGAFILSAVAGATILKRRLQSRVFLLSWIAFGVVVCVVCSFLIGKSVSFETAIVAFALGVSVGLDIPSCLAHFADYSLVENRGRLGSIAFFSVQTLTVLIYIPIGELSIFVSLLILAMWRALGLIGAVLYKPKEELTERKSVDSLSSIFMNRSFAFYFIPWFLFAIVEFVETPLLERFFGPELFNSFSLVGIIVVGVTAFIGGLLCDFRGRKITSIVGFIVLGAGYAVLSLFSGALFSLVYVILDGIAWGLLYVALVFVVWGDLSERGTREKYYLLGGMPFLLSGLIGILAKPFVEVIPIYTSFSLASLFLFLAILPLLYAPETLPEKRIKERELKGYVEKAKKTKEKYT
jgi:MFS family permease